MGSRSTKESRKQTRTRRSKVVPKYKNPQFKIQDLERRMVEQRWVVNGHVMMDYFPVYMPAGVGADA